MTREVFVMAFGVAGLGACLLKPLFVSAQDVAVSDVASSGQAANAAPATAEGSGLALPDDHDDLFSASGMCASCHTGLSDESGADVSIDSAWRSTTMANAARDPYWQASVCGEVLANPQLQAVIEDKCATCHTPLTRTSVAARGEKGVLLGDGFLDPKHVRHSLAMDGVSCTLCHQIEEKGLGGRASFSGGYQIDTKTPWGNRNALGPYPVDEGMSEVMRAVSGFAAAQTQHMKRSELCATCHTLYTPFVDAAGRVAGEFPEQMVYLEYTRSDYRRSRSCRDCHMPQAKGAVAIASMGGEPRHPFVQHEFVGGNAHMLRVLKASAADLGATASGQLFERTIERTTAQLRERTAQLTIKKARLTGSRLEAAVAVRSLVGHKFPAGFPSRRAWVHLTVADADGKVVFESGAVRGDGSIVENDNDVSPARFEPHYSRIDRPDQVQIYEAILGDTEGNVTTTLLRASRYLKDNRLLPKGFAKAGAPADIAVYGAAEKDRDFTGGGDTVVYSIETAGSVAPFTVSAELLFQSIGYRWAENLLRHEAPEVERFSKYFRAVPNLPVTVASAMARVPAKAGPSTRSPRTTAGAKNSLPKAPVP